MSEFKRLWDLGYGPRLLPIIPPDAQVSEHSSLYTRVGTKQDSRGKAVGIKGRDGLWRGFDWLPHTADEHDIERWAAMSAGCGLKCGDGLVGLDADTLDVKSARIIVEATLRHFPPLPVRLGRSPKALYPIRVSGPIPYMRVEFGERDDKNRLKDRVELLGAGRQFVAHGIHPGTQKPYSWPFPLVAFDKLPTVTPEQLVAFLEDLRERLPAAQPIVTEGTGSHADVDQNSLKGDAAAVRKAVSLIPNTTEHFPSRESYLGLGYAVRAALPDQPDEALSIFQEWASRWPEGNDPGTVESDFRRMREPYRRGAQYLYELAEKFQPEQFTKAETWFQPISEADAQTIQPKIYQNLLELITLQDAAKSALAHSSKPLVKGLLDQGTLSVLYGESNTGKTFVAMDLAFHIAAGLPWGGMRSAGLPVLYVAAEGGAGARKRCEAIMRKYGAAAESAPFYLRLSGVNLLRADADLQPLIATVRSLGVMGLIVVDTLSRAMAGGDENASTDMGALVRNIDVLRQATGAHVMAVHHSGKDRAKGARGHSLLRAATDTEIEIADNQVTITKQRDLDKAFATAFVLETVELGRDGDGDIITSCTVGLLRKDELPTGAATPNELLILDAMEGAPGVEDGVTAQELVALVAEQGGSLELASVRFHIRCMTEKQILRKIARGKWVKNDIQKRSSTSFFKTIENVEGKIEVEESGGRSGGNIFE